MEALLLSILVSLIVAWILTPVSKYRETVKRIFRKKPEPILVVNTHTFNEKTWEWETETKRII